MGDLPILGVIFFGGIALYLGICFVRWRRQAGPFDPKTMRAEIERENKRALWDNLFRKLA